MKNLSMLKRLCLVALMAVFGVGLSYAGGGGATTYYAKVRASVGTGSGKVYASESTTNNPSYGDGNVVTKDQSNNQNFTFYMYARAENGYEFTGWSETSNGTELSNSGTNPYSYAVISGETSRDAATENNLYAIFRPLPTFYFSATAVVLPYGAGTVSVNPTTTSVYGEHWNSTSATTNAITFTAEPKSDDYDFQGWSRTENGDIVSTENPYKPTLTSNSTSSNSPTGTTLYARFAEKPIFAFSATAVVTPAGAGTATVDPATTSVRGDKWNSTSATTNEFVFSATPASNYTFLGWSKTADGEIVSQSSSYKPTLTSNNPAASLNTTLYARFQIYPTGITATPASIVLGVNRSSNPISVSLVPQGSYKNIVFETSNSAIATVDANGVVTAKSTAGTATITIKAFKSDGVTVLATASVAVSVLEYCATPVITIAPSSDGKTATVTLSSTTPGATIYYTTDRNDPTASSMPYSSAFSISNGQTVKAIAVKDGYLNSAIATDMYSAEKVATPTIDITTSGVSFSCETPGVSFYYTINGDNPTTSLTPWNGAPLTGLSEGTNIKVIAAKSGMIISDVASKLYYPASGVNGTTMTLNDLEDHTWTYYSGVNTSVDGGNYNDNYVGKLYSPNPRNVKITYNANGGAVSIDEGETSFVYFKTLEQGATAGQYPYTVISNPFSKRPTGKGFGGWKIISGGEYINGYNNGSTLPLDQEITFVNLPYPSTNCISAEIELEATWVNAKVTYLATVNNNDNNYTFNITNGSSTTTYENNFLVINRDYSGILTLSQPVTIMMVEPNATGADPDYRDNYTFTGNITPNNDGVTKIEYAKWNSTNTVNANFRNLWIGRGMTTTSQCASLITGLNTTQSTAGRKFSIKVESGKYDYFDFYKGHSTYTGGTANTSATITGTSANAIITIGNDYDRAQASTNNQNLEFKYGPMFGYQSNFSSRDNRDNSHTLDLTIKSGRIGYTFFMENTTNNNYLQGGAGYCMYLSSAGAHTNVGRRNVLIEGGDICTIGSGIDSYNNAPSNSDTPDKTINHNRLAFNVRIKGGTIHGNVYGGAAQSPSGGNRVMVMTGGHVKGWFAAGCNGTGADGGQNYGTSWVYIGGTAKVDSEGSAKVLGYASGGNVYAAGAGRTGTTTCGEMTFGSNLVIADESYIERGAYGGGNYGYALSETNIYITGGTNEGKDGTVNDVTTKGGVFGGANQQNGPTINMYMTGGLMKGGVYGGCNTQGTISDDVTMQINGGQVGTSSAPANIHGGGYGKNTAVKGSIDMTLGIFGQETKGVEVWGDVYGGSALGYVNFSPTINNNQITGGNYTQNTYTNVTMNKATINGSLYGGALGDASTPANVYGPVEVKVRGGSVKATSVAGSGGVYGANNINGAPQRSVTVDIYGTDPAPAEGEYALYAVYGGGNQADYGGKPIVTVNGCDNSIEYVYGGGNAASVQATDVTIWGGNTIGNVFGGGHGYKEQGIGADVTNNVKVDIKGGTINSVFGGSNSMGNIGGTISLNINKDGSCPMNIAEVYGGGNEAAGNAGVITIGCTGGEDEGIGDVYGGANAADINSDITLNITGGNISRVFGGNNASGNINGSVEVNVDWNTTNPCGVNALGYVYGAGNEAAYTGSPVVNILNGTVTNNVYGGGLGATAVVTGNPKVTIGDNVAEHVAIVNGDVYGGGDAAAVVGTPVVKVLNDCNTKIGNVYGGGNAADVSATDVTIDGGVITGMVFGGGHGDKDATPQKVANVTNDVNVRITGGNINKVFGGSNSKGDIGGDIYLTIEKGDASCPMNIAEVYGGGNEAAGNAGIITIGCTGGEAEGIGDVYGGANAADINTPITLNITGGNISRVFGGNNTSGSINGDIQVNVDWSGTCGVNALGNVYGAGNQAAYSGNTEVNILNGTVTGSVYGGGLGATAVVTGTTKVNIDGSADGHSVMVTQNVLGGGDAAAVTGSTDVNIINGAVSGSVFGGGNAAGVSENGVVDITGGTIASGVYGGSNASGTVGNTTVTLTNGTIGTDAAHANVHGGGYGKETKVSGNVAVNIQGGTIYGDVYGGSALGTVNTDANNTTAVNLTEGLVHGDAYGGGLGDSETAADVNGNVTVTLNGTAFTLATTKDDEDNTIPTSGRVFGCNNINGSPKGTVLVKVLKTVTLDGANIKQKPAKDSGIYELQAVYGGGNLAAYNPTDPFADGQFTSYIYGGNPALHENTDKPVQVVIDGCDLTSIEYVYGGGNAAATPATDVIILGSYEIGNVFGGGNGKDKYKLDGGTSWYKNKGADVGIIDADAYENNHANGLYGTGKSKASVLGGTVHNLFGASNTKGNVVSESLAYVDNAGTCPLNVGGIYGGGNEAYMDGDSKIVLGCIEALEEIYGGARNADVKGDINLTISSGHFDRVFGGNNIGGTINGSITVTIDETGCNPISIGELYGCGNQAAYTTPAGKEHPTINLKSFTSIGNVFGGGLGEDAVVTGNPTVNINVVEGANSERDWAYNGQTITFSDGSKVTLPTHEKGKIGAIGNVFGGGNAAAVIGNTQVNIGTVVSSNADIRGNVYGGGNQANVTGQTNVVIGQ